MAKSPLELIHKHLFYLLILLLPLNLAKHFILNTSYVSGILVDQLIPAIYVTDILILLVLFFWLLQLLVTRVSGGVSETRDVLPHRRFLFVMLGAFLVSLLPSVTSSISLIRFLRFVEVSLFATYVGLNFSVRGFVANRIFALVTPLQLLSVTVICESLLGWLQWFNRGSIFNNYKVFGEIPYNYATYGVVFENFFGSKVIPPYGTFPHPNVFGGFLAFALTIILFFLVTHKVTVLGVCAFFFGSIVLFLTMSVSAWLAFGFGLCVLLAWFLLSAFTEDSGFLGRMVLMWFLSLVVLVSLLSPWLVSLSSGSLGSSSSITRRQDLLQASLAMVRDKPVSGVGLGLFATNLYDYGYVAGNSRFFQPVHNIFYLLGSESGIFALLIFLSLLFYLVFLYLTNFTSSFSVLPVVLLLVLVIIGTFDHYLWTFQQGILMFWLTLGLMFPRIESHAKSTA